jgi:ribosomal protein S12 methylthiotransferase accessory factor
MQAKLSSNPHELRVRVTAEDRGLVEVPILAPHLEFHPLDDDGGLLVSETFNGALRGHLYRDLLPLLDGKRSRHDIVATLAASHPALQVQTALVSLATKGYVVSGEFAMASEQAEFWSTLGASPRWAEARLGAARPAVTGDAGRLASALGETGLRATAASAADATLTIVVTGDYLADAHAEANLGQLATGTDWTLVSTTGVAAQFGPVFRPDDGPCWACLAHRMRGNREVENFLRNVAGNGGAIRPRGEARPFGDAVVRLAAVEIAKWVVLGEVAPLHDHVLSMDAVGPAIVRHPVMRRPQCPACGAAELYRPDRPPLPIRLQPSPKPVRNSGGVRSVPPEETVRAYRHLVSPVSGVVTELLRTTEVADDWLHVYWAGSNLALKSDSLRLLRTSLRTKSSGKGASREQAEASALCEAIERYSGVFHGDEIRCRRAFSAFAEGEAIHPNSVQLFSDWQYEHAAAINARGARFNHVPERFDPEAKMDWTPVWSLTGERPRYLPTSMLYYSMPLDGEKLYCGPDSNGCAAGNTMEEAILQGFLELVERDAFACWWYNRVKLPEVDLGSFGDAWLDGACDYYGAFGRELWVLDATHDLGIPVFVAVSRRTDKDAEDILFSAGAHLDPAVAAFRAVCELNQYLTAVRDVGSDGAYLYDDPEMLWWWRNATLAEMPYLAPDSAAASRGRSDYPVPETSDLREDVEFCRLLVERRGMEFLVLDQTRPDIGMPVAKTIVPGMRHFWARFAPGRLFDVPVRMGWLAAPTDPAALNPVTVFI